MKQIVYSEPQRVIKNSYTTKSGIKKNRYKINTNSIPIKVINHIENTDAKLYLKLKKIGKLPINEETEKIVTYKEWFNLKLKKL